MQVLEIWTLLLKSDFLPTPSTMNLIEVTLPTHKKAFRELPQQLYGHLPVWIRPLDKDIEAVFDAKQNPLFEKGGKAIRWILQDAQGKTIGKVAAFINPKTFEKEEQEKVGGLGFFDCIDDQQAANTLFEAARTWLLAQGATAMDGSVNFGERNEWWGVLVEGFDLEPNYKMPYNAPYYQKLFENYGFQTYFRQFTYGRSSKVGMNERLEKVALRVYNNPDFEFKHIEKSNLAQAAQDLRTVYNKSWVKHKGVGEMSQEDAANIMKKMKPIIDPKLIWFAYDNEKNPIGFYIMIPELNQIFKYLNGKFDLLAKLKFLYHQKVAKSCKKAFGVIFGVVPEYQNKGINLGMGYAYWQESQKETHPYNYMEFNWIGDFNPKMMRMCESLEAKIVKEHLTFRYLFDRNKPFERMPIID